MKRRGVLFRVLNLALLLPLGFGVGLVGGVVLDRHALIALGRSSGISSDDGLDFHLMAEAWNTIKRVYVDRSALQPRPLTYGAISGMVDALGDTGHSTFLSPEMVKRERDFTLGQFKGIGIEIRMRAGHVVIVAPLDGSPAQRAGLHPGDIILKVDGQDIMGLSLDQVVKLILGPAGTSVTLSILGPERGRIRSVTLERASIVVHNVT